MSSAAFNNRRPRPGRPRLIPDTTTQTAREQILGTAARLFVTQGFSATSTRQIADAVGIRQASLYYHFSGKDDILGELLEMTVRPALETLGDLGQLENEDAALYALAFHDASTLAGLMHNIGVLPRLPDVAQTPEWQDYEASRSELRQAYSALGVSCASEAVIETIDKHQLGGLILESVESVIGARAESDAEGDSGATELSLHAIAASCLRLCGVPQDRIDTAAAALPPVSP
ncbi:MAG TPA: TetR/AcrR family transcriptional regulator [Nocardioides sp.]